LILISIGVALGRLYLIKMRLYTTFHLNLSFSSIEEDEHESIIEKCYWPLLDLCEEDRIKISIEASGKTLERINLIDDNWIKKLSSLIDEDKVELIGSGYVQMIAPLTPYEVNHWNHLLGLEIYERYLNVRPKTALINEMAFSSSIIDVIYEVGYDSFIMDESNIKLSFKYDQEWDGLMPNKALSPSNYEMPVLWSNSFIFQKLQQFAHGDINFESYLDFFDKYKSSQMGIVPFYTNDAECFDYRPGRFNTESTIHPHGEWNRIKELMIYLTKNRDITWSTPSEIMPDIASQDTKARILVSSANPAPVKKQPKYNITRWALSGRNDVWINTMCYQIFNKMMDDSELRASKDLKRRLCDLWSSDLRTHITKNRWDKAVGQIHQINEHIDSNIKIRDKTTDTKTEIDDSCENHDSNFEYSTDEENTILKLSTKDVIASLNLRKGLTINKLQFSKFDNPAFGTLPHGYFDSILLGADFYTGGVQSQGFFEGQKISDLQVVEPEIISDKSSITLITSHNTALGDIEKRLSISRQKPMITLNYEFPNWKRGKYFLRVGYLTLLPDFWGNEIEISYLSGGRQREVLRINGDFDHTKPISSLVSSTTAIPVTGGEILISNKDSSISVNWEPHQCAALPMLINKQDKNGYLNRLVFSLQEIDDTLKPDGSIPSFRFRVSVAEKI